jgi:hypothetical protein
MGFIFKLHGVHYRFRRATACISRHKVHMGIRFFNPADEFLDYRMRILTDTVVTDRLPLIWLDWVGGTMAFCVDFEESNHYLLGLR